MLKDAIDIFMAVTHIKTITQLERMNVKQLESIIDEYNIDIKKTLNKIYNDRVKWYMQDYQDKLNDYESRLNTTSESQLVREQFKKFKQIVLKYKNLLL